MMCMTSMRCVCKANVNSPRFLACLMRVRHFKKKLKRNGERVVTIYMFTDVGDKDDDDDAMGMQFMLRMGSMARIVLVQHLEWYVIRYRRCAHDRREIPGARRYLTTYGMRPYNDSRPKLRAYGTNIHNDGEEEVEEDNMYECALNAHIQSLCLSRRAMKSFATSGICALHCDARRYAFLGRCIEKGRNVQYTTSKEDMLRVYAPNSNDTYSRCAMLVVVHVPLYQLLALRIRNEDITFYTISDV